MGGTSASHSFSQDARRSAILFREAAAAFFQNGDLRQASALAFYTTLALIPAMLLLTLLLGLGIGSSQAALAQTRSLVTEVLPRFGGELLDEVGALTRHPRSAGLLNLLVLTWSLTPLATAIREIIAVIFKEPGQRSIWVAKALDVASGLVFITGLAAVAGTGVLLDFLARRGFQPPPVLTFALPFGVTTALVTGLYFAFTPRVRLRHLLTGALVTTGLWFLLRPAFSLFLTYDQGYGFAFGSFKSIFIVIIWIYYSLAVLLFGAEVAAAFHRGDTVFIKRLMQGKRGGALGGRRRFLLEVPAGQVFFQEGEPGLEMYHLLRGTVSIRKHGREIATLGPGQFFGEMTFLLGQERSATAAAAEPCECVVIDGRNFNDLLREFPDTIREMLVEMARRLRETSGRAVHDSAAATPEVQPEAVEESLRS
jgi:membrane protein